MGLPLPQSRPGMRCPHPDLGWGTPLVQTWDRVPPISRMGYSPVHTWDGLPPPPSAPRIGYPLSTPGMGSSPSGPRTGYPHPHLGWGTSPIQTWDGVPLASVDRLKILPSLILRMRAVKTNSVCAI